MFKIESYVTPILLSYVDKYVRDFKPVDAQVSLWGGGVALHNLVLKADVLQQEVALPFTLVSGRIHELLIQVPWTKIMSEPIVVTIDTIECVLSLNPPSSPDDIVPATPSRKTQVVEAPPGYMQALVRRIVSNIALRVHHLIVKYVQDDIVMSLNVKHLAVDSAGPNWVAAFADIDQNQPVLRRLVRLDDLTLCLDKADGDGKIRFFQEPLLYRCQLDLRVLTRLISANTRRATCLNVQLRSSKLAWSVTNEQLVLLLRLIKERPETTSPPQPPKQSVSQPPLNTASSNSAEPARSESWSEWAWSWLPTWADRDIGVEEAPLPATALPIHFSAYLDDISLVFKVMEVEANNRKRSRSVLEVQATHAALKTALCHPTFMRVRIGARLLLVRSQGKCVCGYLNYKSTNFSPTVYLQKASKGEIEEVEDWTWPEEVLNEKVETAEAVDENYQAASTSQAGVPEGEGPQITEEKRPSSLEPQSDKPECDEVDDLWGNMAPLVFVEYLHERSAPTQHINPYENPPKDFEYSDWVEECSLSITIEPIEMRVCMGLIHRLVALTTIYQGQLPEPPELPRRVLTVEEKESLSENLPQKRVKLEARGITVSIMPWSHSLVDKPRPPPLVLQLVMPQTSAVVIAPMYPHRVCSAACQMPEDAGPLWQGARRHMTFTMNSVQVRLANSDGTQSRPCARADIRLVTHHLLHKTFFERRDSVEFSYHLKIKEFNICGSAARLEAACHVPMSLYLEKRSESLVQTSLPKDALNDEDSVAIDVTLEDYGMRGYMTKNVNTHVITLQSAKITALHEPRGGEMKQAWLFSAPDSPTTTPYLRLAIQWCTQPVDNSFDYIGVWTEPLAMSVDPLLISWLAYKPAMKTDISTAAMKTLVGSSQTVRRRVTPPSSSGRGASRTGSGAGLAAELVHVRSRSHGSSSEPSEKKEPKITLPQQKQQPESRWSGEHLVELHKRFRYMLVNVELGLVLLYVTMSTASAIDCATLSDAMERHAAGSHRVLAINLGRLSMHSNPLTKVLWQNLKHDGPTFIVDKPTVESFPWKITLADVSCYTLEVRPTQAANEGREKVHLKSRLRTTKTASPRTVLELVTTTITVSVVTKSVQYKQISRRDVKKVPMSASENKKTRYFSTGLDFKPTTLKEFVRGPEKKRVSETSDITPLPEDLNDTVITIKDGPIVSLGVHLHADTPPLIIRLEHDQIHIVSAAIHCFTHIRNLIKRTPVSVVKPGLSSSSKNLIRSVSELEEIPSASEESVTEMVAIFDRTQENVRPLKTFFWFQWVVSHVQVVVASETVKLALDIDDVISTIDIQAEYNQLKIKLASASIKHFHRNGDEWSAGVLSGRVLEAREPDNAEEDAHFFSVTVTQAQVSDLPASWKEELHPKLLDPNNGSDVMWEIYATLTPLEALIQPNVIENVMTLVREMAPRAFCPLRTEDDDRVLDVQWPFFYLTAGGIRVLVTGEVTGKDRALDDTIIFTVGRISVNPHPENPVCRRAVNAGSDGNWQSANGGFEGRQYEFTVKDVSVQSSKLRELIHAEVVAAEDLKKGTASENPALKWSQRVKMPQVVPILQPVELCCLLAPALYTNSVLTCGPAVELNLVSDCSVELGVAQLVLIQQLHDDYKQATQEDRLSSYFMQSQLMFDKHGVCPYANIIMDEYDITSSDSTLVETPNDSKTSISASAGRTTCDSGVETVASSTKTKLTDDGSFTKKLSVAFVDTADASQFLEVYVTMGVIDMSLYVTDDNSPEVAALHPPDAFDAKPGMSLTATTSLESTLTRKETRETVASRADPSVAPSRSLTEMTREADHGQTMLELPSVRYQARKFEGNIPLLQLTLFQPNVYYWKRKAQKTLQLSLFNMWIGLGVGDDPKRWHAVLLSTAKGVPDPVTDIPPALATCKVVAPSNSSSPLVNSSPRGTVRLDIEKPMQIDLSFDKLRRLKGIYNLLSKNLHQPVRQVAQRETVFLYDLKARLLKEGMESITIQTSQMSVNGYEGIVGWDSASLQVSASARPERLIIRGLVTSLLATTGSVDDKRHILMQPLMFGVELEAIWEAWRRAEGGFAAREPTVRVSVDLDDVTIDLRPAELAAFNRLNRAYNELTKKRLRPSASSSSRDVSTTSIPTPVRTPTRPLEKHPSPLHVDNETTDHFYKDDLRSGAFKILSGGQLPMAYQVMLFGNAVSWRYPHPRAITRVVAFPLPGQNNEIQCVLELYNSMLGRWEPHTYFKLPVGEPRELYLNVTPPETVFATMWRFRVCEDPEPAPPPYEFVMSRFTPRLDPLVVDDTHEPTNMTFNSEVTAEQLSGVLRVDSYFAPRMLPRTKAIVRVAHLGVHIHNSMPLVASHAPHLEGYYVSKSLLRTHRVLTLAARSSTAYAHLGSPAGTLLVLDTNLSCDMVDCATGTMEQFLREFRVQCSVSANQESLSTSRSRVITSGIHVAVHVYRLRTLQALYNDWNISYDLYIRESSSYYDMATMTDVRHRNNHEVAVAAAHALEGRVSLWIHNSCAVAMRVGQEDTDEVVALGPGSRLAYRWRNPTAPKRLRFALAAQATDWHWSNSIPFSLGSNRLKIEAPDLVTGEPNLASGAYLHLKVEDMGASRCMHLSGRLVLANMLRSTLLYKVRAHNISTPQWRTICSGELASETVGRSVVCYKDADMVLKIKFRSHHTCWSGDIPLKECPKENVPWLVKVPTDGESQFVSVWCRVVRGRNDGRILATVWPLYVLHSYLPLDTDVLIVTETAMSVSEDGQQSPTQTRLPPLLQTAPGRGGSTHLHAPGTTAARHNLSFQYRHIECPVTREAVPLHYGVTDTSVFDKRSPVMNIEDVIKDILAWLERSARYASSSWPYSIVSKHWQGQWQPASLQPRCDVTVRYQAVRAGGGCSLEILLSPVALLCNATPISLTLRAYDAAPLCKLEPGTAISPPSPIITKPFFMSVELGRETFVSCQLQVSTEEPGRYGAPPPGQVALDHAANFTIVCNQKVALLTLYYEIKEEINVLGVSSTYMLINRLETDLLLAAVAVPNDMEDTTTLRPKVFKVVPPTKVGSTHGISLSRFWLRGRWRGGDPAELRTYLCLSLTTSTSSTRLPVPIRLGEPPFRRAVALIDNDYNSIPVVVTQMKQEQRWVVVVALDPCPQFVVHNHTSLMMAVAQPKRPLEEPTTSTYEAIRECAGTRWWCMVPPGAAVHYSTPAHCARYPPDTVPPTTVTSPYLIFAKGRDETELEFCLPAVVADGEQLLQYAGSVTIKLRVRTHPHSTLLELQDIDYNDISASDIRRRLLGALEDDLSRPVQSTYNETEYVAGASLERVGADSGLLRGLEDDEHSMMINPGTSDTQSPSRPTSARTSVSTIPAPMGDNSHIMMSSSTNMYSTTIFPKVTPDLDDLDEALEDAGRFCCVISGIAVELSETSDTRPLLALHLDRTAVVVQADDQKTKTTLSIADAQIDNLQYDTGQFDFAVVASTRAAPLEPDRWPPLWNMFAERDTFAARSTSARLLLKLQHDKWEVVNNTYNELTEVEISLGTLALYVEDAYVKALVDLSRALVPASSNADLSEERSMQQPLRLRRLYVLPLDLTLTLHTAVRMYIALDQSPLRLSAFKLRDMMTSAERLTHALTVHYLSAAILGAGWVVGGLELLGAPGALAARVGGATGGVRGVASAAAAALLRSLSAWAGSLARNLDLLAGDEEHARRAAAARRRPPPSFVAGLVAGITNFAINILGAVGGLAHHPLVGVAVGETESGAAALRRGLLGALTKPLSATADLVAYAGSGLLRQTGWDPIPEPRQSWSEIEPREQAGWHRDCVRWMFRLCELTALAGFEVLLDNAAVQLLITHKFLVLADTDTEGIVEMIDFRFCTLEPYQGQIIEISVTQRKRGEANMFETRTGDDDEEYQISAAAMARVARYTGAEGGGQPETRVLLLLPPPGRSHALYSALAVALHHNSDSHFPML